MDNTLENNEWMNEAPFLAKLPRTNPFATPPGYFEGLQENINASVYFDNLKQESENMSMPVPEGYFEDFQERIHNRIAEEEIRAQVQEDGFAVPEGYFENLNTRILSQITEESKPVQTAKIPVRKTKIFKLWHSKAMKYATAACIVIISAVGLYMNQQQFFTDDSVPVQVTKATPQEQTLADIDEQAIIDQIQTGDAQQVANTTATDNEMEDYILNNYSQTDIASNL
jgi:hypothetical protein